jgi:hypothetical protein
VESLPSPLIHSACACLVPYDRVTGRQGFVRTGQTMIGWGLVLLALCGPDVDFLLKQWPRLGVEHGIQLHSLGAAAAFAGAFALTGRALAGWRQRWELLAAIGFGCYSAHVLLDAATMGRGVAVFWPISAERWQTPVTMFFGLHHSRPAAWPIHAATLITELPVVAAMIALGVARRVYASRPQPRRPARDSTTPMPQDHAGLEAPTLQITQRAHAALVDTHVHVHRCHELATMLDTATERFHAHRRRLNLPRDTPGCLILTETAGGSLFRRLAHGAHQSVWPWHVERLDEPCSLRLSRCDRPALYLIAGRQIATSERLEVLAIGLEDKIRDGHDLSDTIHRVLARDALPVIPWGLGKWWGRRGRLVRQQLDQRGGAVALGDNAGRCRWLSPAPWIGQARANGIRVLAGSDPLPLVHEQAKVARLCSVIDVNFDPERPFATIIEGLRRDNAQPRSVGTHESMIGMLRAQSALRWRRCRAGARLGVAR